MSCDLFKEKSIQRFKFNLILHSSNQEPKVYIYFLIYIGSWVLIKYLGLKNKSKFETFEYNID